MKHHLGLSAMRSLVLLFLGTLIGGMSGLFSILVCHYLLNFGGIDEAQKHGISQVQATRIGGVMIAVYLALNLSFQVLALGYSVLNEDSALILVAAAPFLLLGLYEDWRGILSARFRFVMMLLFALTIIYLDPMFIIKPVEVYLLDLLLRHEVIAASLTVLCQAFLPNAFNTADGANGLVSGITIVVVIALGFSGPAHLQGFYYSIAVACLLFLLYNVATGRFFLGDGGAYFLGALVGVGMIVSVNTATRSVWFFLALISYPVIDLLFSVARRGLVGRSPFSPDNEHLHNLLFTKLDKGKFYGAKANTITGLSLAFLFTATPFLVEIFGLALSAQAWFLVYAAHWIAYIALWYYLYLDMRVEALGSG